MPLMFSSMNMSIMFSLIAQQQKKLSQVLLSLLSIFQLLCPQQFRFNEWMLELSTSLKAEQFHKLLMVIWGIWKNVNAIMLSQKAQSAQSIMCSTMTWYLEFRQANAFPLSEVKQSMQMEKPPSNCVKLNVDEAFLPNLTIEGIGGILRNHNGMFLSAFANHINYAIFVKHVELLTIKEGLRILQQNNISNCIVETNCFVAVNDIHTQDYQILEFGKVLDDIVQMLQQGSGISIAFVPRTANVVAHRLVAEAFQSITCKN